MDSMISHIDHMDTMSWYDIRWATMTTRAIYGETLDHMDSMISHNDHMDSMNWYNITWHLTTRAIDNKTLDRVGNILWATMTIWTLWIGTTYTRPREQHMASHLTTWTPRTDTIYGETHGHYELVQYMASHCDHMDTMNWYNIWQATVTTWTLWIDTIYGKPLWPYGHYELVQYMASHCDHMDTMNWYNIWQATVTTWTA